PTASMKMGAAGRTACRSLARLQPCDFAVLDLHDVDGRYVLAAFLSWAPLLDEGDVTVEAVHLDVPERLLDRRRLGLARGFHRRNDRHDTIVATEALGQATDVMLACVPFGHERLGDVRELHGIRKPRREEHQVHRTVR